MKLIGIGHKKHVGKDTFAQILKEELEKDSKNRVVIRGFAKSLKQDIAGLLGIYEEEIEENKEVFRPIMQWYGTDYIKNYRKLPKHWIDKLDQCILTWNPTHFIIPDVRFKDEAEYVKSNGGILIKINRPNIQSTDKHSSECELSDYTGWDGELNNNGTLYDLRKATKYIVEHYITK
jgi:hypothetical protein